MSLEVLADLRIFMKIAPAKREIPPITARGIKSVEGTVSTFSYFLDVRFLRAYL